MQDTRALKKRYLWFVLANGLLFRIHDDYKSIRYGQTRLSE